MALVAKRPSALARRAAVVAKVASGVPSPALRPPGALAAVGNDEPVNAALAALAPTRVPVRVRLDASLLRTGPPLSSLEGVEVPTFVAPDVPALTRVGCVAVPFRRRATAAASALVVTEERSTFPAAVAPGAPEAYATLGARDAAVGLATAVAHDALPPFRCADPLRTD